MRFLSRSSLPETSPPIFMFSAAPPSSPATSRVSAAFRSRLTPRQRTSGRAGRGQQRPAGGEAHLFPAVFSRGVSQYFQKYHLKRKENRECWEACWCCGQRLECVGVCRGTNRCVHIRLLLRMAVVVLQGLLLAGKLHEKCRVLQASFLTGQYHP